MAPNPRRSYFCTSRGGCEHCLLPCSWQLKQVPVSSLMGSILRIVFSVAAGLRGSRLRNLCGLLMQLSPSPATLPWEQPTLSQWEPWFWDRLAMPGIGHGRLAVVCVCHMCQP